MLQIRKHWKNHFTYKHRIMLIIYLFLIILFHFIAYFISFFILCHFLWKFKNFSLNLFFKKVLLTFKLITNCFQFTYSYQYQWHDLDQQEVLRSMLRRARSQARLFENSLNLVNLIRNSERKENIDQKVNNICILSIAMRIYYRLQCEHIIDCNANILSINCCVSSDMKISKKRNINHLKIFISTICSKNQS